MSCCRFKLETIFLLTILFGLSAPAQVRGQKWSAQWEPSKLVNGSPVLFRVSAPLQLSELQGNFLGQEFSFRSSEACHCWYAFAGVSLATKPGTYTLRVAGKDRGGKETAMSYLVRVSAAHYPVSTIKVAPAFVEPPKEARTGDYCGGCRKEAGIRDIGSKSAVVRSIRATDTDPDFGSVRQRPDL